MNGQQDSKGSGAVDWNLASNQRTKHHVPSADYPDELKTVLRGSENRRIEVLGCKLGVETRRHMLDHFGRPAHPLVVRTFELLKLDYATGRVSLKG
jgi:hypothetical protein